MSYQHIDEKIQSVRISLERLDSTKSEFLRELSTSLNLTPPPGLILQLNNNGSISGKFFGAEVYAKPRHIVLNGLFQAIEYNWRVEKDGISYPLMFMYLTTDTDSVYKDADGKNRLFGWRNTYLSKFIFEVLIDEFVKCQLFRPSEK